MKNCIAVEFYRKLGVLHFLVWACWERRGFWKNRYGRTQSDAVVVAQHAEERCDSCCRPIEHFQKPAFHCNQCDYTVCPTCDGPRVHPAHPAHPLFLITPTLFWFCDACKRNGGEIEETTCFNCEQCDFHLCQTCFSPINRPLHQHALTRTDVRYVYHSSHGEWSCDICHCNNGPGHYLPSHCKTCQFDLCDNCIKPWRSTFHQEPGHILYKADSNLIYPTFNGGWRCDRCSRSFVPQLNNTPFHCSRCEFDLCRDCMTSTSELSNYDGFDVPRPSSNDVSQDTTRLGLPGFSGSRGGVPITTRGLPIASPTEDIDNSVDQTGPPEAGGECVICLERPKDATIVHGNTGHVCCCTECARELQRMRARCPICRAPIDTVIKQYTV